MKLENIVALFVLSFLWGWVFISSCSIVAGGFYFFTENIMISGLCGGVVGFICSEYVRRKYGLIQFFGRLVSHREIDGNHKKYPE